MSTVYLLWDESHIWGLLVRRALRTLGIAHRVVRAKAITQGLLASKPPHVLLVPGGVARRKALALGEEGMRAIRDYVAGGGSYLGFCGGAGLGLTAKYSLGLCPWKRAAMKDRMLHLVSGHMRVSRPADSSLAAPPEFSDPAFLAPGEAPRIPVWWPARFEPEADTDVTVLAAYDTPSSDFWAADLPLDSLPREAFRDWETLYGVQLWPEFMRGQPAVIHGPHGKGRYVLSYAHLETANSPHANAWMCHILDELGRAAGGPPLEATSHAVPAWDLRHEPVAWDDPVLSRAVRELDGLVALGREQFLLFDRNDWLFGWRAGLPGANLNNYHSLLRMVVRREPCDAALAYWREQAEAFDRNLTLFRDSAQGYLLAERLALTLSKAAPDMVSQEALKEQRTALFGPPMELGGLYADLLVVLDELAALQLETDPDA